MRQGTSKGVVPLYVMSKRADRKKEENILTQNTGFSSLPISEEIKRAVEEMGFKEATVIQSQSIPVILSGRDVIGHSQTGTGKTAAFGIPALEKINEAKRGLTQVLILCPTRELAMQSSEEMHKFAKYKSGIRIVPVYGGASIENQIRALKRGAEIIIGTPGRVMDHMRRKTIKLQDLSMIILDEADEMLNMGFREDIETILRDVPATRQTILFSATMSDEIMAITTEYQTEPVLVKVVRKEMTLPNISQFFYDVPKGRKLDVLSRLLDFYNPQRAMVFCNTKKMVDELLEELRSRGFMAEGLHGDMKQAARTAVMESYKRGRVAILIATDVAARGIDVDDVDIVFNFDLPSDMEYYVHRIGRTGRAGKEGMSVTLVSGRSQLYAIRDVERFTKSKIKLNTIPTLHEVAEAKNQKLVRDIRGIIDRGGMLEKHKKAVEALAAEGIDPSEVACAVLKMMYAHESDAAINDAEDVIASDSRGFFDKRDGKGAGKSFGKDGKKAGVRRSAVPVARFSITIGKKDKVGVNHIVGAVAGESGLPGKVIGNIDIRENHTFFEVPKNVVDDVLRTVNGCKIRGKRVTVELVKTK